MSASLRSWLEPLKELQPGRPIVDRFVYELQPDFDPNQFNRFDNHPERGEKIGEILREEFRGIDLRVTFKCTRGISTAATGLFYPPQVDMEHGTQNTREMRHILLHEIGHTFGANDTYVHGTRHSRGGLSRTLGMQPASIMSIPWKFPDGEFGEDDKRAIIWLYKYYHENLAPDDCFFDDYVSVEDERGVRGCEPRYPLIFEVKHNPTWYALQILKDDPNLDVNAQDVGGMTALHYAVMYEKVEVVNALLDHENIDVNAQDVGGMTALHYAVMSEKVEVIEAVRDHENTKPSLKNKQGKTPLDIAREANHTAIAAMLPENEPRKPSLDVAPGTNLTTTWGAMKQR